MSFTPASKCIETSCIDSKMVTMLMFTGDDSQILQCMEQSIREGHISKSSIVISNVFDTFEPLCTYFGVRIMDDWVDDNEFLIVPTPTSMVCKATVNALRQLEKLSKGFCDVVLIGTLPLCQWFMEGHLVKKIVWPLGMREWPANIESIVHECFKPDVDGALTYVNHAENQYDEAIRRILAEQTVIPGRAPSNVGTLAIHGQHMRFSLLNGILPCGTTRYTWIRGAFEDLMWCLRGQSDSKILEALGVNVWKAQTSREFLDFRGLHHRREGDVGPSYGINWRHYGAKYEGCDANYAGKGFDQLEYIIHLLKTNPHSRRIIVNLWNPDAIDDCALPPCLYGYEFFVKDKQLTCVMHQRSSDVLLAGFWNITQGALLTHMLGRICDLEPFELVWNVGSMHIYENQVEAAKEYLMHSSTNFPVIAFNYNAPPRSYKKITDFKYSDLVICGYRPATNLKVAFNA